MCVADLKAAVLEGRQQGHLQCTGCALCVGHTVCVGLNNRTVRDMYYIVYQITQALHVIAGPSAGTFTGVSALWGSSTALPSKQAT